MAGSSINRENFWEFAPCCRKAMRSAAAESLDGLIIDFAVEVASTKAWYSVGQYRKFEGSFNEWMAYVARTVSANVEFWANFAPCQGTICAAVRRIVKDPPAAERLIHAACLKGLLAYSGRPGCFGWWMIRAIALRPAAIDSIEDYVRLNLCLSAYRAIAKPRPSCFRLWMLGVAEAVADDWLHNGNFTRRVGPYQGLIRSIAADIVKDEDAVNEVESRAIAKGYNSVDQYLPGTSLKSWMVAVATNEAISLCRERSKVGQIPDWLDPAEDGAWVMDAALTASIYAAAEQLKDELRITVQLRHGQGLGFEEMAEILGLPMSTVSTHYYRALGEIRAKMNPLAAHKLGGAK